METKKLHQQSARTAQSVWKILHPPVPSLFPSLQVRVEEHLKGLWFFTSQEMKRGAPGRAVTKKSMVPVLKHIYAHSHTDSLYKQCRRHLPGYWQGSPGAAASSQLFFRSSPPHGGDFITLVILWISNYPLSSREPLPTLSLILFVLCLFVCLLVDLFCVYVLLLPHSILLYLPISPSSPSFSHIPSHLACSSSISKQTHFLLTLGSVAVICCACQVEY